MQTEIKVSEENPFACNKVGRRFTTEPEYTKTT